ncbi:MAG: tetratricopeptide repeat protein [Bacteriovoracaceae bacterium]
MLKPKKSSLKTNLLIFIAGLMIQACDFTPPINKEILSAQELIKENAYEEAVKSYFKILKKNPNNDVRVKINYQIGDLYSIYLSDIEESLSYYEEVIKIAFDQRWKQKAQQRLADLYLNHLKDNVKAENLYRDLLNAESDEKNKALYRYRIALANYNDFDFNKAKPIFEKLSKENFGGYTLKSFYYLGMIEFYKENWKAAIRYLEMYVKRENKREELIQAKFILANALESRENLNKAYDLYYSILPEYPNTQVIKDKLKAIYNRRLARKRN